CAALGAREEWLEDPLDVGRIDSGAAVCHLQIRATKAAEPAVSQLDRRLGGALQCMRYRVLAEVPNDLVQLAGVDTDLEVFGCRINEQPLCGQLQCGTKFIAETQCPFREMHDLGARQV